MRRKRSKISCKNKRKQSSLYNKKKSHALSLLPGVQFPSGLTALDPNIIMLDNPEKSTTLSKKDGAQFSLKETNDKTVAEKSHKMQNKGYLN